MVKINRLETKPSRARRPQNTNHNPLLSVPLPALCLDKKTTNKQDEVDVGIIISFDSHFLLNDGVWPRSLHIDDSCNEREWSSVSCYVIRR